MKLAKLSLKRARLSCMSWKCIMFASRSDMASDSSAKAGSKALRGNEGPPPVLALADSRKEERDEGRSGVVGRETLVRDVERFLSCDMVLVSVFVVVGYCRGGVAFPRALIRTELAGCDALLSRLTTGLPGTEAVFGPVGGAAIDNQRPNLGVLARIPSPPPRVLDSGGVLVPGARPASPSCRTVPDDPACDLPALDRKDLALGDIGAATQRAGASTGYQLPEYGNPAPGVLPCQSVSRPRCARRGAHISFCISMIIPRTNAMWACGF